jgi:DNA-binding SARP family transcriptional activator
MIRLRTLGTLDLRSPEQDELRQVLAQPKRFALLVYLAAAGGGAFHRRDTLFALFWPESDAERARSSLRTALHFLRRALGAEVIASRGTEEVGVAAGTVWCDALAFEAELDAGRPVAALELYRGPFLAGFNLAGVAEWERWVSVERERLRRRAVEAAEMLAARAEENGDVQAVAKWARRAAALEPEDEGSLRRLMTRLAATGDRAGAIYAFEEFSKRLRADCEAEPSRQTRALADEIRRGAADPEPVTPPSNPPAPAPFVLPVPVPAVPEPVVAAESAPGTPAALTEAEPPSAPAPDPAAPATTQRRTPAQRRWRWIAAVAAIVALTVAGVWWTREVTEGKRGPARVAVLPFAVYGRGDMGYLREGMVDLLSAKLDGAGDLRSVDARALLSAAGAGSAVSPAAGGEAAERLGAELFVMGRWKKDRSSSYARRCTAWTAASPPSRTTSPWRARATRFPGWWTG